MVGTLYVVATPIGHLDDLSVRARRILSEVDAVVCEDTRVSRKLLGAHGIERPTVSHHAHSSDEETARLCDRLTRGEQLALISDAGTPMVSDPGLRLVERALARGAAVVPVPGPSAVLAALVGSGLPPQPFVFLGFLPRAGRERREALGPYVRLPATLVLYEAPGRLAETLGFLAEACGPERPACVARELTKRFETFERGTLAELAARFAEGARGEIVVVVGPPRDGEGAPPTEEALRGEARRLLDAGVAPSEAAKTLAAAFGLRKKQAYRAVLDVSGEA